MKLWPGICQRLVMSSIFVAILLPWAVLISIDAIAALTSELDELEQGDYDLLIASAYVALSLPRRAYELFPSAAVIGCLMGLGGLAASSEITVMRAAGISRRRLGMTAGLVVGAMAACMALVGETLGPWGDRLGEAWVVAAKSGGTALLRKHDLWARDDSNFINAKHGISHDEPSGSWLELQDVSIYATAEDGRLTSITHAREAEFRSGRWTLFEARRTKFLDHQVETVEFESQPWESTLNPDVLQFSFNGTRYQAMDDLEKQIEFAHRNNMDDSSLREAYWARVFYPLHAITLSLAALPFAFGSQRAGGAGKRLFVGVVFGLGFLIAQRLFITMASLQGVDLRVANLLIPAAIVLVGAGVFRLRRE